jgi:glycosyltransferase involved in cell wall biosynthesis
MGSEAPATGGSGAASADQWTVAVVIPARDEAALLPRCLASVLAAADHARHAADVLVVVLADRCVDETAAVAAQALAGTWASVVHTMAGNVGQARQLGCAAVRSICRSVPSDRLWIAMTDADTTVPTDWIVRQLAIAANGWDAVTGTIEIDDWSERSPTVARARGLHRDAQRRAGIPPSTAPTSASVRPRSMRRRRAGVGAGRGRRTGQQAACRAAAGVRGARPGRDDECASQRADTRGLQQPAGRLRGAGVRLTRVSHPPPG